MGITKKMHAFTLIEILVVIGILSLVLPIVITIIFTITNQQLKIQKLSQVKREGDFTLNVMKSIIRNYGSKLYNGDPAGSGIEVCQPCTNCSYSSPNGTMFYIKDKFDKNIRFYLDVDNRIASYSSAMVSNPTYLTTFDVLISNYSIGCSRATANSHPVVSLNFTICYKNKTTETCLQTAGSNRAEEEPISFDYQTKIKLRN